MNSNLKKPIRKPYGYQPVRTRKKANGSGDTYSYEYYERMNNKESENENRIMPKKLIRLTEGDLHRIVKESVQRILNEVEFGGESLHGNNPEDWATVSHLRDANVARDEDLSDYNRYYQGLANPRYSALNNRRQGVKDVMNMRDTVKGSEDPDAFGKAYDAGREKAKSIINNRNREKMNKQFGGW